MNAEDTLFQFATARVETLVSYQYLVSVSALL